MDRIDLRGVEKQTPEICLKAVEQDGFALRYVQDHESPQAATRFAIAMTLVKLKEVE